MQIDNRRVIKPLVILSLLMYFNTQAQDDLKIPDFPMSGSFYAGTIGDYPIVMYISFEGEGTTGYYYYTKYRKIKQLSGPTGDCEFALYENGNPDLERFNFDCPGNNDNMQLTGVWLKKAGTDYLDVVLDQPTSDSDWGYAWLERFLGSMKKYNFEKPVKSANMNFEMAHHVINQIDNIYAGEIYTKTDFNEGPKMAWHPDDYIRPLGYVIKKNYVAVILACKLSGNAKPWYDRFDDYGRYVLTFKHNGVAISSMMYAGVEEGMGDDYVKAISSSSGLNKKLEFSIEVETTFQDAKPTFEYRDYYIDDLGTIEAKQ